MRILIDPGFLVYFVDLDKQNQRKAQQALKKCGEASQRHGLNFEKLKGLDEVYSLRVDRNYRILLRKSGKKSPIYVAFEVGPHSKIYRR